MCIQTCAVQCFRIELVTADQMQKNSRSIFVWIKRDCRTIEADDFIVIDCNLLNIIDTHSPLKGGDYGRC